MPDFPVFSFLPDCLCLKRPWPDLFLLLPSKPDCLLAPPPYWTILYLPVEVLNVVLLTKCSEGFSNLRHCHTHTFSGTWLIGDLLTVTEDHLNQTWTRVVEPETLSCAAQDFVNLSLGWDFELSEPAYWNRPLVSRVPVQIHPNTISAGSSINEFKSTLSLIFSG